jgi:hypothetical protein
LRFSAMILRSSSLFFLAKGHSHSKCHGLRMQAIQVTSGET